MNSLVRSTIIAALIVGTAVTTRVRANTQANQIVPVTCAAVFATAADEYHRLGRKQDSEASDYLATQFAQYTIRTAQDSSRARVDTRRQLRAAADMERVTAQINGGLKYLQPRIGACVGLADRLGI